MKAIEIKDLKYIYDVDTESELTALDGVTFDVDEGEFIALIGANGSGKSTLARLLNGLLLPASGSVNVFGIPTTDAKKIYELRSNLGVVFQNPDNQMIATIIEDDVAFGPENLGLPSAEIEKRVQWALECVGMEDHRKGTPYRLSGGQKQRIAIAGVLAIKPKIMVLDESTAMLDPRGKKEVLEVVENLVHNEKITVIMITHFPEEAVRADRVIVMDKGKIAADGKPADVFENIDLLRAAKVDAPMATRVAKTLREKGYDMADGIVTTDKLAEALCRLK